VLDLPATVEAIARARCELTPWQPRLRQRRQPWLELQLVFDGSPSMALWRRLRRELPRALASQVRWRDLRCWQLLSRPDGTLTLTDLRGRPCPPQRLVQRGGRSLVLVVSDGLAAAWFDGRAAELLQLWAAVQPLALLQVLPQRLWLRTALAEQAAGWIRADLPMRPHGLLSWQPVEGGPPRQPQPAGSDGAAILTLPVLRLQEEFLSAYAHLLSGSGQGSALAYRLEGRLADRAAAPGGLASGDDGAAHDDTEDLLAAFLFSASAGARRLLALLTFAPVITLPIVRLIHGQMAAGAGADAVAEQAEVLFSGLFVPASAATDPPIPVDQQRLGLVDERLRIRLRQGLQRWQGRAVFDRVQEFVARSLNLGVDAFQALLREPDGNDQADPELLRAFATVAPSCLRGLGGSYEALAEQLEQRWRHRSPPPPPPPAPWLEGLESEELPFATAQVLWVPPLERVTVPMQAMPPRASSKVPPLERVTVTTAQWQELELRQVAFQTLAPADLGDFLLQVRRQGGAAARAALPTATASAFHEPLQRDGLSFAATAERPDPLTLTLVEIPGGSFQMGSPRAEPERSSDEGPQHLVQLQTFFMAQTPITQAQWREVALWQERPGESWGRELKPDPSRFQIRDWYANPERGLLPGENSTDDRPVECVSWLEAMEFCHRLSQRTGRTYTLPSEAQWEYACRAGTTTPFAFGETITPELANYNWKYSYAKGSKGSKGINREQTTPVGMFPANAWGLRDMHGNVWEWCLDHWHRSYTGAPADGTAWVNGGDQREGSGRQADRQQAQDNAGDDARRLLRGGSWFNDPRSCRSACRSNFRPDDRSDGLGFRACCLPQGRFLNA
jgi:formylglycine-generating enzyme required for sulfatase activity